MTQIGDAAETLLAMLVVEFNKPGQLGNFCSAAVMPGSAVPYDEGQEACGGSLWVRLTTANPSAAFPAADTTVNNCAVTLAYPFEVGVMRPAPLAEMIGDELVLPTEEENTAAALRQLEDMETMYRTLVMFGDEVEALLPGIYTPIGPEGGVVGGKWTFTIGLI